MARVDWPSLLSQTLLTSPETLPHPRGVHGPHRLGIACWPLLRAGRCVDTEGRRPGLALKMPLEEEGLISAPLSPVTVQIPSTLWVSGGFPVFVLPRTEGRPHPSLVPCFSPWGRPGADDSITSVSSALCFGQKRLISQGHLGHFPFLRTRLNSSRAEAMSCSLY